MQDLSNVHPNVDEVENEPGDLSPILEISPDKGLFYRILNRVQRGRQAGVPLYLDLRDSDGNKLPVGTTVGIRFESPGDEEPYLVSELRDNIQAWNNLSIRDQQEEEYIDSVKLPLKGPKLNVRDIDTAYLVIDSTAVVDWSQSQAYIEGNAVTEAPKGGN